MYASIRKYATSDVVQVARRVNEEFLPILREVPGFEAYYAIEDGDGTLITVTVCRDKSGVENSVSEAANFVRGNLAGVIAGYPTVVNGRVAARATAADSGSGSGQPFRSQAAESS